MFGYTRQKFTRFKEELTVQPMLSTFLKSCCAYGVDPVNVLMDPAGAARSASLFDFARTSLPSDPKPVRPKKVLVIARKILKRELAKADGADMLPLRAIANEAGVSLGYLNYRFGEMVTEHSSRRTAALDKRNELRFKSAVDLLKAELLPLYRSPAIPSIDHLASAGPTSWREH
jgi:AcrR family transcriptional regulator